MSLMCDICKCSTDGVSGCESGCLCCNPTTSLDALLETRTAQLLALTDKERESGESDNPILNGEHAPNRFATLTLFFTDSDGVRIDEDLDLSEITVTYFTDDEERVLTGGALYNWAIEFYRDNY